MKNRGDQFIGRRQQDIPSSADTFVAAFASLGARLAPTAAKKFLLAFARPLATDESFDTLRHLSKLIPRGFAFPFGIPDPTTTVRDRRPPPPRAKNVAMDEPFYYLSAEDVVPRDARHVIIGGSVRVVPPDTFVGHKRLARVELREGVEAIGAGAFRRCCNLARVVCPCSLRKIGAGAFEGCGRLLELILPEGLRRIGEAAFYGCGVERITVPSSVVEIGEYAFAHCNSLEAVTLAGGMALVESNAFLRCPRLERITISSLAIVVEAGWWGGRAAEVTGGIDNDCYDELAPARLILTSRYLDSMSQEDRKKMTDAINQIIEDQTQGEGLGYLDNEDEAHQIRACFANCLAKYKTGVAAVLELALWKANINQRRGETARVDAPTRDDCRRTCGAEIVVGPVLSYLWGPHRRADHPPRRRW